MSTPTHPLIHFPLRLPPSPRLTWSLRNAAGYRRPLMNYQDGVAIVEEIHTYNGVGGREAGPFAGDELFAVGGEVASRLSYNAVVDRIRSSTRPIVLTFRQVCHNNDGVIICVADVEACLVTGTDCLEICGVSFMSYQQYQQQPTTLYIHSGNHTNCYYDKDILTCSLSVSHPSPPSSPLHSPPHLTSTQPNPTQPSVAQLYPTELKPTEPNPTQPNR